MDKKCKHCPYIKSGICAGDGNPHVATNTGETKSFECPQKDFKNHWNLLATIIAVMLAAPILIFHALFFALWVIVNKLLMIVARLYIKAGNRVEARLIVNLLDYTRLEKMNEFEEENNNVVC